MAKRDRTSPTVVTRRADVARVLGCHVRTFADYLAEGCPGRPGHYELVEIVAWVRENKWQRATGDGSADDPMLSGPATPALERFRAARAEQEELKLAEQKRRLVRVEDITESLGDAADILRGTAGALGDEFGAKCREMLDNALDEIEALFDRELTGGDDGARTGAG